MARPEMILIAAIAESNQVIGNRGKVPWSIPADRRRFRDRTLGYAVIMGRKTWELDLECRPLVERQNIVVSSMPQPATLEQSDSPPVLWVTSLELALEKSVRQAKVFLIGGASIYQQGLTLADAWELTFVEGSYDGDTCFPPYRHLIDSLFFLMECDRHSGFRFETYRKVV